LLCFLLSASSIDSNFTNLNTDNIHLCMYVCIYCICLSMLIYASLINLFCTISIGSSKQGEEITRGKIKLMHMDACMYGAMQHRIHNIISPSFWHT
jgi:hypothetical protein